MIIPVPNTEVWRGKIRLATAYCATKKKCSNDFPKIEKYQEQEIYRDPRPIAFEGNKIVVGEKSLPELQGVSSTFSPWLHATSLIGVEFVNIEPYFKQFDFGESAGLEVFRHRCQYCHGVRGVGASLGWDYVDPLPVYTLRTAETLLNHVKNKKMQALERGLLMPNQKDVSQQEAKALWQWMKAAATNKIRNYKP